MKDTIIALTLSAIMTTLIVGGLSLATYENEQRLLEESIELCKADKDRVFVKLKGTLNAYLCKDII